MAKQGISIRAAADRLTEKGKPISEAGLRKWIKKGYLKTLDDGSLDPEMLEAQAALAEKKQSPIHGGRREKAVLGAHEAKPAETALSGLKGASFEDLRKATEARKARQMDLDYAAQAKELLSRPKVEKALTDLGAITRSVLERIPDRHAPALAAETDPHVIRMKLMDALNEAMEEIASTAARTAKGIIA